MFRLCSTTLPTWSLCSVHICVAVAVILANSRVVRSQSSHTALLNYTFKNPDTGRPTHETSAKGLFSKKGKLDTEWGSVVHVKTTDKAHGCRPAVNIPHGKWIALIERGACSFDETIENTEGISNASAVVLYNKESVKDDQALAQEHNVVSVFVPKRLGDHLAELVDNGTAVTLNITLGPQAEPAGAASAAALTFTLLAAVCCLILYPIL